MTELVASGVIRQKLIDAAIEAFCEKEYNQVSIRALASKADVNSAMIAYYFNNKLGLFEAALFAVLEPIISKIKQQDGIENIEQLIELFHQHVPAKFAKLLISTIISSNQDLRNVVVNRLLKPALIQMKLWLTNLEQQGKLRCDPNLLRLLIPGLLVFPMVIADTFGSATNQDIKEEQFEALKKIQIQMFTSGVF